MRISRFLRSTMKKLSKEKRELKRDQNIGKLGGLTWKNRITKIQESAKRKEAKQLAKAQG